MVVRFAYFQSFQHGELRVIVSANVALLVFGLFRILGHELVGFESLELHVICTSGGCNVDKLPCHIHVAIVVYSGLRYNNCFNSHLSYDLKLAANSPCSYPYGCSFPPWRWSLFWSTFLFLE